MSITKRIFSLLLILAITFTCLISCDPISSEEMIKAADAALKENAYTVEIDIDYTSDNTDLNNIFKTLEDMKIEMAVNGENSKLDLEMMVDVEGILMAVDMEYVLIGNKLYLKSNMNVAGYSTGSKVKTTLTEENLRDFASDTGIMHGMTSADFDSLEASLTEDGMVIKCNGIRSDAMSELDSFITDQFDDIDITCEIKNVCLTVEIEDGKYDTTTLSCDFSVVQDGSESLVHMEIAMEYDYEDDDESIVISAPSDPSSYNEVTYEELMQG